MKLKSGIKNNNDDIFQINKLTSKKILNMIIKNENIDFKKLKITNLKKKITSLKEFYHIYDKKLKSESNKIKPRYFTFWKILQDHYKIINFDLVSKKKENVSAKSKCKSNVVYTCFTRFLGYNPSLLSICLNASYIKRIINSKNYLFSKKITSNFHSFEKKEKKIFFEVINKGEVQIISPICPDYEYKKIGENIFSFTFNALNTGIGLPGQRILDEIKNIYAFLEKNNINFTHDAFYGDFESFSKMNCKRLKINQELFLEKLSKSVNTLKRKKIFNKVGLFVNDLSNLKDWNFLMNQNRKKINLKFKKDLSFKKKVIEILNARKNLYLNWFPKKTNGFYLNVLLEQGAEYASMTDIILKKFSNPLIIAADHPKMKLFYNFNKPIGLAYLQKVY